MIQIDDKIISFDVIEEFFKCDLPKCKGICCYEGKSGAPLEKNEIEKIKKIYPKIKKYLPLKNIAIIEKKGFHEIDDEGDTVTTLVDGKECVFAYQENGIFKCAFETAYLNNETDFKKPISCHLFPIRIKKYDNFIAVNLIKAKICSPAFFRGKKEKIKAYEFLKEPLIRAFGKDFFYKLDYAAKYLKISK